MSRVQRQITLKYYLQDNNRRSFKRSKGYCVKQRRKQRWRSHHAYKISADLDWEFVPPPLVPEYRSPIPYTCIEKFLSAHLQQPENIVRNKIAQFRPKFLRKQIYDSYFHMSTVIDDEVYVFQYRSFRRVGDRHLYGFFFCPIRKTLENAATATQPTFHDMVFGLYASQP